MSIIISSGFWIDGDDEREIVFLFAYLASTPKINKEDIYQAIRHVGGEETIEKVGMIDYSRFKFSNYPFEHELFENVHLFALLRQFQCQYRGTGHQVEKISPKKMMDYLTRMYEQNEQENRERFEHVIHTVFYDQIPEDRRVVLIELLMKTNFHLQLFPYEMKMLDFRQDFFVRKMYYAHPHRKPVVEAFLERMASLLKVDLFKCSTSIIYFLVSENIFVFEKQEYFHLIIYSTLGA